MDETYEMDAVEMALFEHDMGVYVTMADTGCTWEEADMEEREFERSLRNA